MVCLGKRQTQRKCGALSESRIHGDHAAVLRHHVLDDAQTQTGTSGLP